MEDFLENFSRNRASHVPSAIVFTNLLIVADLFSLIFMYMCICSIFGLLLSAKNIEVHVEEIIKLIWEASGQL